MKKAPVPSTKVDEFTLVSTPDCPRPEDWSRIANYEIERIGNAMGLIDYLGPANLSPAPLAGYNKGYDFGLHSFVAKGSFHDGRPDSGVAIKLSAQALEHLCAVSGMHPRDVLAGAFAIEDAPHASRIDLAADYLDNGPTAQEINDGISCGDFAIFREQVDGLHEASKNTRSFNANMGVQTLYIGKRVKNIRSLVRIYNKAAEQIARKGTHLPIALDSTLWTRVELELHHEYANQAARIISLCPDNTSADLAVAEIIHSRCQCHYVDEDGKPLTNEEGECIGELDWSAALSHPEAAPLLRPKKVQPLELLQAYAYHATDSGLMALLDKAIGVWGKDAAGAIMKGLLAEHKGHTPSKRTKKWIDKRADEVRASYPDVTSFIAAAAPYVKARRNDVRYY